MSGDCLLKRNMRVKGVTFDIINRYGQPYPEEELEEKILEAYSELERMDLGESV